MPCLKWEHRRNLLKQEILSSGADIVCLEEVDHFQDYFQPSLAHAGFEGVFTPKHDSPCLDSKPNNGPDGCAIFYKSSCYKLIDKKELRLQHRAQPEDPVAVSNQVALIVKLECLTQADSSSNPQLCVAVTHLKAKRPYEQIRYTQGQYLLEEVTRYNDHLPTIVCGDFNAPPTEKVYSVFEQHSSQLASAYYTASEGREPEFTSWKHREAGESIYTIDYIWYTKNQLQLSAVWSLPSRECIGANGLPALQYPSDHLALGAELTLS